MSGLTLCTVTPDRVWTCYGKIIGVAEGKQSWSRPTLVGDKLMQQYKADKPFGRETAQLQQVCGQLHHNGLKYGVCCTPMNAFGSCGMNQTLRKGYYTCQRVS